MYARFFRQPLFLGLTGLFLLTAATLFLAFAPAVDSAGGNPAYELVSQSATDNVMRISMSTNDIVYNPQDQMIYVSRPSSAGSEGNSITRLNPLTGQVAASVFVGSEPNRLALSDNGQTLYVTLDGAYAVRRYEISTQTPGIQFAVGRGQSVNASDAPYRASDIAVVPGSPHLLAVARSIPGISPPGAGVAIYNNGVMLPQTGPGHSAGANYLAFSSSPATLYGGGYDQGLRTMTVNENGVTDTTGNGTNFSVRSLKFENNLVFTSNGQVINPETRTLLGTCAGIDTRAFVPDTATGRVLYAVRENFSTVTIKACDINTFAFIGSMSIPISSESHPTSLVRYGTNGLAMRSYEGNIYLIQTSLIPTQNPLPAPSATPPVTPTPSPTVFARFMRQVTLPNKDLIYNRTEQKFYATVPSAAGTPRANSITRIEPSTATLENSVAVGPEPGRLAISDDDQTIYVGINGSNAVRKFDVATQTPGLQFSLGMGTNGPKTAYDMDVLPGNANAVAVSYGSSSYNNDGVDIYDEGVKRAQRSNASGSIEFASPTTLFVGEYYLYKFGVAPNGVTLQGSFSTGSNGEAELVGNLLYTAGGGVLDLNTTEFRGSFTGVGYWSAPVVDVPNNRVFFLVNESNTGGTGWSIKAFRLDTFVPVGVISMPQMIIYNNASRFYRWGENGLAFTDNNNKIYLLQTDLVSSAVAVPTALQLGAPSYNVSENAGLQVTVLRSGGLNGSSSVNYATVDGTATAGVDYTATAGTLVFAPGESSKTITIPLLDDNVFEGNETLSLSLSNPNGAGTIEIQGPTTAALTINDNEGQPSAMSSGITVAEPRLTGSTAVFTVRLSNATMQTVTLNYATLNGSATAGSDFVAASGMLTFAPLETVKTISVQILPDQNYTEPTEFFSMSFTNPVNAWVNSSQVQANIINYNPQTAARVRYDFDNDGRTDLSIFRPSAGEWWYLRSSDGGNYAAQFGQSTDVLTPGDFTGDLKTDIAIFRPESGEWFVLRSEDSSYYSYPFGTSGDLPVVGDFDGDTKADSGVFRPSSATWYIRRSSDGTALIQQFGQTGDVPVVADYDNDRKADMAIYRPGLGQWWIQRSNLGSIAFQFGAPTDKPVQGDYTGDGKADVAFWRPSSGEWFVLRSENQSYYSFPFGVSTDVPAPGDYDGDGKIDATVFRPSDNTWYSQRTTAGTLIQAFGQTGDKPVPSAFIP